jgi:hypothetical protein
MDLAAVFALSLLGGYFFAAWWRLTSYATRRYEGHHLYFRAALCGVIFFALALLLRTQVLSHIPVLKGWDETLIDYVKAALKEEPNEPQATESRRAEWLATALYSLALAPLTAWLLNRCTPILWAQRRTVGELDKLLLRAQQESSPVAVTLDSGKVYIGLVISITDPDDEPPVIVLLPMFSGHRDPQNEMVLTSDYEDLYKSLRNPAVRQQLSLPDDWTRQFQIVIRAQSIITANLFSTAVYAKFNPDWKQRIAHQAQKPAPQELTVQIKEPPVPPWRRASRGRWPE